MLVKVWVWTIEFEAEIELTICKILSSMRMK